VDIAEKMNANFKLIRRQLSDFIDSTINIFMESNDKTLRLTLEKNNKTGYKLVNICKLYDYVIKNKTCIIMVKNIENMLICKNIPKEYLAFIDNRFKIPVKINNNISHNNNIINIELNLFKNILNFVDEDELVYNKMKNCIISAEKNYYKPPQYFLIDVEVEANQENKLYEMIVPPNEIKSNNNDKSFITNIKINAHYIQPLYQNVVINNRNIELTMHYLFNKEIIDELIEMNCGKLLNIFATDVNLLMKHFISAVVRNIWSMGDLYNNYGSFWYSFANSNYYYKFEFSFFKSEMKQLQTIVIHHNNYKNYSLKKVKNYRLIEETSVSEIYDENEKTIIPPDDDNVIIIKEIFDISFTKNKEYAVKSFSELIPKMLLPRTAPPKDNKIKIEVKKKNVDKKIYYEFKCIERNAIPVKDLIQRLEKIDTIPAYTYLLYNDDNIYFRCKFSIYYLLNLDIVNDLKLEEKFLVKKTGIVRQLRKMLNYLRVRFPKDAEYSNLMDAKYNLQECNFVNLLINKAPKFNISKPIPAQNNEPVVVNTCLTQGLAIVNHVNVFSFLENYLEIKYLEADSNIKKRKTLKKYILRNETDKEIINRRTEMFNVITKIIKKSPNYMSQGCCYIRDVGLSKNLNYQELGLLKDYFRNKKGFDAYDDEQLADLIIAINYGHLRLTNKEDFKLYEKMVKRLEYNNYNMMRHLIDQKMYKKVIITTNFVSKVYYIYQGSKFVNDERITEIFTDEKGFDNYTVELDGEPLEQEIDYNEVEVIKPPKRRMRTYKNFNQKIRKVTDNLKLYYKNLIDIKTIDTYIPNGNEYIAIENLKNPIIALCSPKYKYCLSASIPKNYLLNRIIFNEMKNVKRQYKNMRRMTFNLEGLKLTDHMKLNMIENLISI